MPREYAIKHGISKNAEPEKIERDLLAVIPKEMYYDVNHLLMWHGRNICTARNPKCTSCPISDYCEFNRNHSTATKLK